MQLVEIPTTDETHDNIVAYWLPKKPVRAGDELAYEYKLYWQNDEPNPPVNIGRVVSTHAGAGGVPGVPHPDDADKRKFVIDFAGGPLARWSSASMSPRSSRIRAAASTTPTSSRSSARTVGARCST